MAAHSGTLHARSCFLFEPALQGKTDAAATQERLRKCGGRQGGGKGITISHSPLEPIVASSRRTPPARNSELLLTSPTTLLIGGYVLSRRRPGSPSMVSGSMWWGWRRKVFTLLGTAWSKGLDILPGSLAQRAFTRDFRLGWGNLPTQKPATYKPRS